MEYGDNKNGERRMRNGVLENERGQLKSF